MRLLLAFDPLCPWQHGTGSLSRADSGHLQEVWAKPHKMIKTNLFVSKQIISSNVAHSLTYQCPLSAWMHTDRKPTVLTQLLREVKREKSYNEVY